jgi:hypothetical protein
MGHMGRFTKTPYLVLFVILAGAGIGTVYAGIVLPTITLSGNVDVTGDTTLQGQLTCTDCVDSADVADGSIVAADLGDSLCADDNVLKWNDATTSWECAPDEIGAGPLEWVNQPPVVNAGQDQTTSTSAVTVSATVTDTTIPGILTSGPWSKLSGPGLVFFDSINSATTDVAFIGTGIYVLRYTANDGLLSGSDTVQITVN